MTDAVSQCRQSWTADSAGRLLVGELPIDDIIDLAGGTPTFVYSRGIVEASVRAVRGILGDVELFFSIKANPFQPILDLLSMIVDGFDVASKGELLKAFCSGMKGDEIQVSGPGKDRDDFERAVAAGALINVESSGQLELAVAAAADRGRLPKIVIRVNAHSLPASSGLRMGGVASQFGVDIEQVPTIIEQCRSHSIEPHGFHFYWGTQCLDGQKIAATQRECWRIAGRLADSSCVELKFLNLGGGFGIPYYAGDESLDLAPIEDSLAEIRAAHLQRDPSARLAIELGRYLVGPAGMYVVRILDVKTAAGTTIAVTDGGMHHHLAASGNLGQAIPRSMPCFVPTRMAEASVSAVRVVGRLCTSIDVLCPEAQLPSIEPGQLLAIFQSGAYGPTASPRDFLSHPPVSEVVL